MDAIFFGIFSQEYIDCIFGLLNVIIGHLNLCIKILFLKINLLPNHFTGKGTVLWCNDPFFFDIIETSDNRDDNSCKGRQWFVHAYDIRILLVPVRCDNPLNLPIVNGIIQRSVFRVHTP